MKSAYDAIGVVEARYFTNALVVLDAMEKAGDVEFIRAEKKLGGRMVSFFVGGRTDDVLAAIAQARSMDETLPDHPVKLAEAILKPHPEIMKLIMPPKARSRSKR